MRWFSAGNLAKVLGLTHPLLRKVPRDFQQPEIAKTLVLNLHS